MQLRDIQYAVTVGKELSFSRAADKLFVSQPALSQSIRRLERELGIPLFVRNHHYVELTEAGQLFMKEGDHILVLSERLKQRITDIAHNKSEHLRFGISPFYSKFYLPRIVPLFNRKFPSISMDIVEMPSGILEQMIMNNELEFGMLPMPAAHDELDFQPIYQEQILFAIPKNHPLNDEVTPAMSAGMPFIDLRLAQYAPFVFLKKEQKFASMGMRLCREAGFEPNIVFETMNWETVNSLVATGMGVGFVPELLVGATNLGERPTYCRIMAEYTTRPYVVAYKRGRPLSPTALRFIDIAKQSFLDLNLSNNSV